MIRYAPASPAPAPFSTAEKTPSVAAKKPTKTVIVAPSPAQQPVAQLVTDPLAQPAATPFKPDAEPLALTGEPAPKAKKAAAGAARKRKESGGKPAKAGGIADAGDGGGQVLMLDLEA